MKEILVATLLGQLDVAIKASASPVAMAFDADGTLWSGDAGEDFLFAMIARKLVLPEAAEALDREARSCGLSCGGASPTEVVRALFDAYVSGQYAEENICRVTAWACAGYDEESVRKMAHGFLVDAKLASRALPETQAIAAFAKERGVPIYVVSASPAYVVSAGLRLLGIECEGLLAVVPHYALGRMLPSCAEPIPYGKGKRTLLDATLRQASGRKLLAAFGDNVFDLPMLTAAEHGVAIRPKKRLLDALGPGDAESLWHLLPPEARGD